MNGRCGKHMADCTDVKCLDHGESRILYVYGTLRPGNSGKITKVPGRIYDLGWFPGLKLDGGGEVIVEAITVEDWDKVDAYEGYDPNFPDESLYIRKPFRDGFIYVYNQPIHQPDSKLVRSGDWLDYTKAKRGRYGDQSITG